MLVIFPVNALRQPPEIATAVLLVARNVISAAGSATLHGTVLRAAATEVDLVAVNKPATPAVASVTWLVTAPMVRSATTVEKSDMFLGTVPLKLRVNGFAITANNLATFKLPVLTRSVSNLGHSSVLSYQYIHEIRVSRRSRGSKPCSSKLFEHPSCHSVV